MGHHHLPPLPQTRKFREVVELLENGAPAAQVAAATVRAAEDFLQGAYHDEGLVEVCWLLMQLPQAARSDNFAGRLRDLGIRIGDDPSLPELEMALTEAVDNRLRRNRGRTDLGEMAQAAASETISAIIGPRLASLFAPQPGEVRDQFAALHTVAQFGKFARGFFSRLVYKCLDYFLARDTSKHIDPGKRFATTGHVSRFAEALETHCRETSVIVETFAGEWFEKTVFKFGGVSRDEAAKFAHGAASKLVDELKVRAVTNGH
jgi:hypothetical protein